MRACRHPLTHDIYILGHRGWDTQCRSDGSITRSADGTPA